jgi:glycerol-3-phosphate dehydrogenase
MILSGARSPTDLGTWYAGDLTEAEVRYLRDEEWAMTADDVLSRRTKLGLVVPRRAAAAIDRWLGAEQKVAAVAMA